MGIRFACPNGHPLHVKADLAGKRGVCPECQARFLIPQPQTLKSAPQAEQTAPSPAAAASPTPTDTPQPATAASTAPVAPPAPVAVTPPPPDPAPAQAAPSAPAAEVAAWYIRPSSGGQFGPADDALVQQWTAEGRVAADSYVWRNGWPDWRLASELPEHFPQLQAAAAAPLLPSSEYNTSTSVPGRPTQASDDPAIVAARYKRRKQQAARGQQLIAVLLVLLTIALAGVLVWVIYSMNNPKPPASAEPAAPVPTAVDPAAGDATEQETEGANDEAMEAEPPE